VRCWVGILALIACQVGYGNIQAANDQAVVYLVRHAEKQVVGEDPGLNEAGRKRAVELARLLQDAGIEVIYSTDFARTLQTAAPLAEQLGLTVHIYEWERIRELAAGMLRNGGRYLVVGHSDTTPELVGILGGDPGPPIDEVTEYDRLYLVTIGIDGNVTTEMRRYGQSGEP